MKVPLVYIPVAMSRATFNLLSLADGKIRGHKKNALLGALKYHQFDRKIKRTEHIPVYLPYKILLSLLEVYLRVIVRVA